MASSKKGKKSKGKTVALVEFLQDTPGSVPSLPVRKATLNWADDVDENHDVYDSRSSKAAQNLILPTAPKASRDFDDIIDKVPQDPPFIAYLSNLPYDVDEEEITAFFKNLKISNMRIPKDERSGDVPKLKGFGYVEFEDRDSLLNALVIPDTTIKNRRIRIDIATDYDNDKRRGGRMDMNRDRGGRSDVSTGDWRSGPRQESNDGGERRGFSRDRERDDSNSAWRDGARPNREPERGFTRSSFRDDRERDDKSFMSRNRNDGDRGNRFESERGNRFESERGNRFESERGNRFESERGNRFESERGNRFESERGNRFESDRGSRFDSDRGSRYDNDRGSRDGGGFSRNQAPREDTDSNRGENSLGDGRQRPRLVLAPRSKTVEGDSDKASNSTSIFGNAKPVDTAAKERQIEERLAKDNDPPPRRDFHRDTAEPPHDKESHQDGTREKDKASDYDKKPIERSTNVPKQDVNGVSEKPYQAKRNGDEKRDQREKTDVSDKPKPETKKREEKKDKVEKEMPKMKPVEPPNFIANNKFAFLETEDPDD